MTRAPFRHMAIWLDGSQAILLASESEPSGEGLCIGQATAVLNTACEQHPAMQQYHDAVLSHLGPGDEMLILGPG